MSTRDQGSAVFLHIIPAFGFDPFANITMYNANSGAASSGTPRVTLWPRGNKTSSVTKSSFTMTSYGKVTKGRAIDCQCNPAGFFHCSHCRIFLSFLIESSGSCWSVEKEENKGAERQKEDKGGQMSPWHPWQGCWWPGSKLRALRCLIWWRHLFYPPRWRLWSLKITRSYCNICKVWNYGIIISRFFIFSQN